MRQAIKSLALVLLQFWPVRSILNVIYNATGDRGRRKVYSLCAKIFRGQTPSFAPSIWTVDVAPFHLKLPMRPDWAWLDWDAALASLGNDQEVKSFYAAILGSRHKPAAFVDIGANYGVHTSLMRSAGVKTISFEPNPECFLYFSEVRKLNGAAAWQDCIWHPMALGSAPGSVRLAFPDKSTWLGHIAGANEDLTGLKVLDVPMQRLDDMQIEAAPVLVKIDAEGSELSILKGGRTFLESQCSFFIFETLDSRERAGLFEQIAAMGFSIQQLPLLDIDDTAPMPLDSFIAATGTNFVARNSRSIARRA